MGKKKLTLQEKLAKRHFKVPNILSYGIYSFASKHVIGKKYHTKYIIRDNINDCHGPAFLIWNHQSRRDHAFITAITSPRRISILAGYNEFFRAHLHTVFKMMNIIPKKQYTNDVISLRGMNEVIRKGGVVCFSPEGTSSINGMNQPIAPGTGRFLQFYHIPVYLVTVKGAYLTNTKVDAFKDNIGEVECTLSLLFSPDDFKKYTVSEIEDIINDKFTFDDYAYNKEKHTLYKNDGNICNHLADLCYRCPKCGEEFAMEASGNHIECKKCGNGATMDDYFDFHPYNEECVIPESPCAWDILERKQIIDDIRANPSYSFTEHVKVGYLPPYQYVKNHATTVLCGEGDLTIDHDGIHYWGTKLGESWSFDLSYKAYFTASYETDLQCFYLFVNEEFYEFTPARASSEKIRLLVEEMHRLHVNTWKNLKCQDYLYPEN